MEKVGKSKVFSMSEANVSMLVMLALVVTMSTGCARRGDGSQDLEKSHVRAVTILHGLAVAKLGHEPRDEKEFKQAIAKLSVTPEKMKVGSFDELFVSERDGKPLIVIYGSPTKNSDVLVYEQTGVNGKRLLGHRIGVVEDVDDAQLKSLTKQ
jgi:hypothetical protein